MIGLLATLTVLCIGDSLTSWDQSYCDQSIYMTVNIGEATTSTEWWLDPDVLTDRIMPALLSGRIQPYLLAGVGMMHFEARDLLALGRRLEGQDLAARFGGGVDLYVTPSIALYLDVTYVLTTGDVEGFDHVGLTLGAIYRF